MINLEKATVKNLKQALEVLEKSGLGDLPLATYLDDEINITLACVNNTGLTVPSTKATRILFSIL